MSPAGARPFDALARRAAPLLDRVDAHGVQALSGPERVVWLVWVATGQLDNGGLDLLFCNAIGDHAREAPAAFRAVGAAARAATIERALALFPASRPPTDRDARVALLDALAARTDDDLFAALDDAYHAAAEDVDVLLAAYVAAHDAEIGRPRDETDG